MKATKNEQLILTEKDFLNNWENSKLLKDVRYSELVWIDDKLHTKYTAIMGGNEIEILTY